MIPPGHRIDERYRILHPLGRGGMGYVYAAYDELLGRSVALKLLRPAEVDDPDARTRLLREAQIAAQLSHPSVVRTYDVGESQDGIYLVQELLHGRTLDHTIPLPPTQAIQIACAIADVLVYMHRQGYVHCDIKPANVMLVEEGEREQVVLLDFGIAGTLTDSTLGVMATPDYSAPERAHGAPPSAAVDVYALGIMLYQMLSGRLPFAATTVPAIILRHLYAPLPPLELDAPNAQAIGELIGRLVAKHPAHRPTAATVRAELQAVLEELQRSQPLVSIAVPMSALPQGRQRRVAVGVAMLTFGLFVALGAVRIPSSTPSAAERTPRVVQSLSVADIVRIPNVLGISIAEAQQQIEQRGLALFAGEPVPSDQPAGTVVSMTPGPGEDVAPGTAIILEISAGPAVVPVQPTATAVLTAAAVPPTATPSPTATPAPLTVTPFPTATPVRPTATAVPVIATRVPPTATSAPATATPLPTVTLVPPTATPFPTATAVMPTSIVATPTDTPVSPTDTPAPPTATSIPTVTPVPSTATAVPTTLTPLPTATRLPTATTAPATATRVPPTATPIPSGDG